MRGFRVFLLVMVLLSPTQVLATDFPPCVVTLQVSEHEGGIDYLLLDLTEGCLLMVGVPENAHQIWVRNPRASTHNQRQAIISIPRLSSPVRLQYVFGEFSANCYYRDGEKEELPVRIQHLQPATQSKSQV